MGRAQSHCYWSPDPCLMLFNHSKDIQAYLKHIYCVTFHTTSREKKKGPERRPMSVEKLFNTGFTSRSFQWNRVLKLYFFFPPSTINHSRLISSCNLRLFLISYSTKSLHCNKPFPSSLFQRESKCETLIVISSNFNMNDQGYSQQRLRN